MVAEPTVPDRSDETRVLNTARLGSGGPRPGDRLADRYELREEIGRGGMGRVFRAHDPVLGRDVAVKVLTHAGPAGGDFQRACAREARAAARLVHHGIVTVFDVGTHDGASYLVMELVPGRSLHEILAAEGKLPVGRAVEIAEQVADALAYAHRHGVFHCDVKPHNVIVTPGVGAKLVDFGIASAATATGAISRDEIYGSAPYLAPEQVRGEPASAAADVYALGVVLYEMLVGRPPFIGPTVSAVLARRLTDDPEPPRSLEPTIPPELERVVLTALAREPSRRYPDAGAFRDALRGLATGARADTLEVNLSELRGRPAPVADGRTELVTAPRPRSGGADRAAGTADELSGRSRLLLGLAGLAALLAVVLLVAALAGRPGGPSDAGKDLPGVGWARFTKRSCEWSNVTTPPAVCFGERDAGYRVRVVEPSGQRWLIWDPETRDVAYVDPDALRRE